VRPNLAASAPIAQYSLPTSSPRALALATAFLSIGCLAIGASMPDTLVEVDVYRHCAIWLAPTLGISLAIQASGNLRRLIRADVVALFVLYFLTFAEFLSPSVQVLFAGLTGKAHQASWLVLVTFISISIGRHFPLPIGLKPFGMPTISLFGFFWIAVACFFLGYLWPLITVNFNPVTWVTEALGPRFSQPWQRGRLGDWSSLLSELELLHFAFAALVGVMFSARPGLPWIGRATLILMVLLMMFLDFATGTRYVLVIKVGLMISGYVAGGRRTASLKFWLAAALGLAVIWFASGEMLRLRNLGVAAYFAEENSQELAGGVLIDNNLITIARAAAVFPDSYPYPGSDIVVSSLTKWIPRAIWPGKPTDWGTSLEEAFGLDGGYTLAVTVTGEAYLISGWLSLVIVGLLIGSICSVWNRLGEMVRSNLDLVVFVSLFFPLALCMRSLQFVTVATLPTFAIYLFGKFLASKRQRPVTHREAGMRQVT
jgi:hypothetical protein